MGCFSQSKKMLHEILVTDVLQRVPMTKALQSMCKASSWKQRAREFTPKPRSSLSLTPQQPEKFMLIILQAVERSLDIYLSHLDNSHDGYQSISSIVKEMDVP